MEKLPQEEELLHPCAHQGAVAAGTLVEQALQVGADQNIHAGGHGLEERAVGVVRALAEEIGQHVVTVAGADQAADGQAHAHGIIPGQDIAKVAGRHHEVDALPHADGAALDQVGVGR